MKYTVELKASVAVFDAVEKKYNRKETTVDFCCHTPEAVAVLVMNLMTYADDPLDLRIKREDD